MVLKKHLNEIKKGIIGVLEEGKKRLYKAISFIEQKVESDEGFTGKIKDITGEITEKGKEMHDVIKKEGGYCAALKRARSATCDSTKGLLENAEKRFQAFESQFSTNGKFDYEKTKIVLRDRKAAICRFGKKTVDTLYKIVLEGEGAIREDYRTFVPNKQERETKYAEIGAQYQGILLREDFERCLNFHKKVRSKLPGGLKTRNRILEDIKVGAIGDKKDLIEFYKQNSYIDMAKFIRKSL